MRKKTRFKKNINRFSPEIKQKAEEWMKLRELKPNYIKEAKKWWFIPLYSKEEKQINNARSLEEFNKLKTQIKNRRQFFANQAWMIILFTLILVFYDLFLDWFKAPNQEEWDLEEEKKPVIKEKWTFRKRWKVKLIIFLVILFLLVIVIREILLLRGKNSN